MVRKDTWYLNLLRLALWPEHSPGHEPSWRIFHVLLRRIYSLLLLHGMFYIGLFGPLVYSIVQASLLVFQLDYLPIVGSVMLKFTTFIVLLFIPSVLLMFILYI